MKTRKTLILLSCVLLSSCENIFKEECEAKGYLKGMVSEKSLSPLTTEELQVRYYDYYNNVEHTEKQGEPDYFAANNKFLAALEPNQYRVLAYSRFNNKIRNADDLSTIEIYADTVISAKYGMPVIANTQRMVYMAAEEAVILPEDTTHRVFVLSPMVQKIVFNVRVRGLGVDEKIADIEALLSGVILSRKIYTNQPQASYAGQIFSFTATDAGQYSSEAYVFGLSNKVENVLKMEIITNTDRYYPEVDLSSVLRQFTADGIVFELVIDLNNGIAPVVTITDWRDLDWGEILPVL